MYYIYYIHILSISLGSPPTLYYLHNVVAIPDWMNSGNLVGLAEEDSPWFALVLYLKKRRRGKKKSSNRGKPIKQPATTPTVVWVISVPIPKKTISARDHPLNKTTP